MASKHTKYHSLMKAFGKAMRFHRTKLGLSQEALADRAQLDRSYMSQIERGIKNVTLNSIWRISQALGVNPSDLLKLTEEIESTGLDPGSLAAAEGQVVDQTPATGFPAQLSSAAGRPILVVNKRTVLVVDDDEDICFMVDSVLRDVGFQTVRASSGFDAMRIVASVRVDAVVSDIRMANGNGIELLETMRKHYPKVPVFFITGYDDVTAEDAIRRGARGLFSKPFDMSNFVSTLKSSVQN